MKVYGGDGSLLLAEQSFLSFIDGSARLSYVSATAIQLGLGVIPLKVDGIWQARAIPSAISLSNASLLARGLYQIYARDSAGATVLEAGGELLVFDCLTASNTSESLRSAAAQTKLAQSFQVTTAGLLDAIEAQLRKIASPTGYEWFTIEADSGGAPSGTPLGTSEKIDVSTLQTTAGAAFQTVRFPTPVSLATGTTYWLVLQGDFTISGVNYTDWVGSTTNVYASGSAARYDGSTWSAASGPLDFGPRGYIVIPHVTDASGVEVRSGNSTRTLVGMVWMDGNSQFADIALVSWFSRKHKTKRTAESSNPTTTSTSYVNLDTARDIIFVTWGDETALALAMAAVSNTQAKYVAMQIYYDDVGPTYPSAMIGTVPIAGQYTGLGAEQVAALVEGVHKMSVYGLVEAGTGTWIGATFNPCVEIKG
jgi:hypothetical protein